MSSDHSASTAADAPTDSHSAAGLTAVSGGRRGVSYALGFVVVFSVVLAGTLALFVAGVDLLSDVDRDGALAASEENVEVVHAEVGDMVEQGGERRQMSLELVDAQVRFTDSPTVRLRVESEDADLGDIEYDTRALRYEVPPHDTTFVYALGHLYRVDERGDGGSVSERPPVFEVSDRQTRLVVPVLTGPTAGSPTEIGASGTSERDLVALRSGRPASLTRTGTGGGNATTTGVDDISGTVVIEGTDHPSAWVSALDATGFENVTTEQGIVTGQFESDRLTVQRADIAFALGGETATGEDAGSTSEFARGEPET
jgi:hypothetical protein